jgi:hypothetical protein
VIQGCSSSSLAVRRFDGSLTKQCPKKSLSSDDILSGSGGSPSFAILNIAVIWLKWKYGGCPVNSSNIVQPKDLV